MMRRLFVAVIFCLIGAGCANKPTPINSALRAPVSRLLAFQSPGEGTVAISFVLDSGARGSACFAGLHINGTLVGRLANGEAATFYVPAGEVVMRAGGDPHGKGICAGGGANSTQRETQLTLGSPKVFRVLNGPGYRWDIERVL